MCSDRPSFRMVHGVILRNRELQKRSISVADGKIVKANLPEVDVGGYWVLPGIVDVFSDAFEQSWNSRKAPAGNVTYSLQAIEKQTKKSGVTTTNIAMSWSSQSPLQLPENADEVLRAFCAYQDNSHTDIRKLMRCDTNLSNTQDQITETLQRYGFSYALLQDHFISPMGPQSTMDAPQNTHRFLCNLATKFEQLGIQFGSVGDLNGDTRERFSMLGARLCAFPRSKSAAQVAKAVGDPVVLKARDIICPPAPVAGFSALHLVRLGLGDMLASGQSFCDLAKAAFSLVENNVRSLPDAWDMVSAKPAGALGLYDRGELANGNRADIVLVNQETREVEATIADGRVVYATGKAASQLSHMMA